MKNPHIPYYNMPQYHPQNSRVNDLPTGYPSGPTSYQTPLPQQQMQGLGMQNQLSGMQNQMPAMQNQLPAMQNQLPAMQNQLPAMQNQLPAMQSNTSAVGPAIYPNFLPQIITQQGNPLSPISTGSQPEALTLESLEYMNGFLRTQIGKKVKVDFLIGNNSMVDKFGTLIGVGANYILINEVETDDILLCDFYSIKFISFYY